MRSSITFLVVFLFADTTLAQCAAGTHQCGSLANDAGDTCTFPGISSGGVGIFTSDAGTCSGSSPCVGTGGGFACLCSGDGATCTGTPGVCCGQHTNGMVGSGCDACCCTDPPSPTGACGACSNNAACTCYHNSGNTCSTIEGSVGTFSTTTNACTCPGVSFQHSDDSCASFGTCGTTGCGGGGCSGCGTSGTGVCCLTGGASGDPHIAGPHGERFDFFGQTGGDYVLFSSSRFVLNTLLDILDIGHPFARFMKQIALIIGNVTVIFDTVFHDDNFLDNINKQLVPNGAKATYGANRFQVRVDLCSGQSVVLTQMVSPDFNTTTYYLDVELDIAGCHDDFGGIIGQMYKCKYANGEQFVWDSTTEETFRVPALNKPSGTFANNADCLAKHEYGTLLTNGKTKATAK